MAILNYIDYARPWVVAVLFLGFVVFSFLWQTAGHRIMQVVGKRRWWPLMHMLRRLEEELLSVGMISVILVLLQNQLLKICVKESWVADEDPSLSTPNRRLLESSADEAPEAEQHDSAHHHACKPGHAPLFTKKTLHAVHILIYSVVFLHVVFSFIFILVAWLRVRKWRKWEAAGRQGVVGEAPRKSLKTLGQSWVSHWLQVCVRPAGGISGGTYLCIRRLFLETLMETTSQEGVDLQFAFHDFCQYALGDFMAKLVSLNWALWLSGFGVFSIVSLYAISMKLQSVLLHSSVRAHYRFKREKLVDIHGGQQPPKDAEPGGAECCLDHIVPLPEPFDPPQVVLQTGQCPATPLRVSPTFMDRKHRVVDTVEELFLFQRPGLLLALQKVIYFGTALTLALVLSSLYGHTGKYTQYVSFSYLGAILLLVQLLLLLLNAWNVLPTYVLVTMARQDAGLKALEWLNEDRFIEEHTVLVEASHRRHHHHGGVASGIDTKKDIEMGSVGESPAFEKSLAQTSPHP